VAIRARRVREVHEAPALQLIVPLAREDAGHEVAHRHDQRLGHRLQLGHEHLREALLDEIAVLHELGVAIEVLAADEHRVAQR
jgi:hypothetical protein